MNIIRLVNIHNEEDILRENLNWYMNQGIPILANNNSSTDRSNEILQSYVGKGVLEVNNIHTKYFDRDLLFDEISKLSHKYNPDWLIFADCDEFYEPADPQFGNLTELIKQVDSEGDNLIQFHNCEFWMTPVDDYSIENPLKRIKHYSYFDSNRFKAFKFYDGFSLVPKKGHGPTFPDNVDIRLSDRKGISRHYKFRNLEQASYKIKRVVPEPDKPNFGFHYNKFKEDASWYIINPEKLNFYKEDSNWNLERKFDGNRMNREELCAYLGLQDLNALEEWFQDRAKIRK
ncbi:MAG: glycosyltransferase family 2 protein [Candidatus Woesearchaeota archaeon]